MLLCSYQVSSHEDFRVLGIPSFPPPPWMITPQSPCVLGGADPPLSPCTLCGADPPLSPCALGGADLPLSTCALGGLTLPSVPLCPRWG